MITAIMFIGIIASIVGYFLYTYNRDWKETLGSVMQTLGIVFASIAAVAFIILLTLSIRVTKVEDRIVMYQEENSKIESQIAEVVNQYQKYEADIFESVSKENAISYITLFPELKSDTLVQKQIETYIANNEKIKELKEAAIMAPVYRWWLYFGR